MACPGCLVAVAGTDGLGAQTSVFDNEAARTGLWFMAGLVFAYITVYVTPQVFGLRRIKGGHSARRRRR
jgi:hypothetical protein